MSRYCPRCDNKRLFENQLEDKLALTQGQTLEKIEVDECLHCHGIFFDVDEAESGVGADQKLLDLHNTQRLPQTCTSCKTENPQTATQCKQCKEPLGLACPGCEQRMYPVDVLGIELDACPSCHAMWFDAGELEKLQRRYARKMRKPLRVMTCAICNKEGLTPSNSYLTRDKVFCRDCFSSYNNRYTPEAAGVAEEASFTTQLIGAWIAMDVIDAVFNLFSSE